MNTKLLAVIVALMFIVACGTTYLAFNVYQQESVKKNSLAQAQGEDKKTTILKSTEQVKEQEKPSTVNIEMNSGEFEKAENVPANQERAILASFKEYIAAFNEKDLERYKKVISKNAEGFQYEEDVQAVAQVFKQYDVHREAADVMIVNYKAKEAQVFSNLKTKTKDIETGSENVGNGSQVTVFAKVGDDWKVTSVYYKGNDKSKAQVNKHEVYDFMEEKFNRITNFGETYIPEIHDPLVAELAAEHFDITQEEADAIYIDVAMNMYN